MPHGVGGGVQQPSVSVSHQVSNGFLGVRLGGANQTNRATADPAGGVHAGQRLAIFTQHAATLVRNHVALRVKRHTLDRAGGVTNGAVNSLHRPVSEHAGALHRAVTGETGALSA